ncbi:zeta toxin family protein [Calycomorphotria hydatis]|uniref:Zeta toxin n=1 Tax=Calycomorphotria hydatis TaxID=2528027 RepID=A0A517T857_9PLAN|nr:zeta toxin family protein [Calycomorphotria hydatis]QDT64556.1 Zeta toxin [Calycomorphotria hydatis]
MTSDSAEQPVMVAIAGPNGAGKSTFYYAYLAEARLSFINADELASEFEVGAYEAAKLADSLRRELLALRESFIFETVFSDPVGEKVQFLQDAEKAGFHVLLCFVGVSSSHVSRDRVALRVSKGGHDVPDVKLDARYPRTMENLKRAIESLQEVHVFDNSDFNEPHRLIASFKAGECRFLVEDLPTWFTSVWTPPEQEERDE